mgnify:CR=1 FL=1
MRVLITGGSSLLGKYLTESKPDSVILQSTWFTRYIPTCTYQLNVCDKSQVAYVFEQAKPDVVIHCAAVGSVDYTEVYYDETRQVNVLGTENILKASQDASALFVHISTNAVFSGRNPPYDEDDNKNPVNAYGRIKREAEYLVEDSRSWLMIRPFLLYGYPYPGGRSNWLVTILNRLGKGEDVKLVDDTYWQPSLALDVAQAIWKLIELGKQGVYHVASDDRMSLYGFGLKVVTEWGYDIGLIEPISSSKLNLKATRPVDTTFKLDKIHELGIRLRSVEEGLKVLK